MFDITSVLTQQDQLPLETFDWGQLQWIANGKLLPGCVQTLGLCRIRPGQGNPRHYHPNCEELLYVVQGEGRHSLDGDWVELRAGSTIRIPPGMKHNLINTGTDELICWIAFSSGDRQTVFL